VPTRQILDRAFAERYGVAAINVISFHGKVVDHVDRRDAVSLGEGTVEDLPGRHNWHAGPSPRDAIHLG